MPRIEDSLQIYDTLTEWLRAINTQSEYMGDLDSISTVSQYRGLPTLVHDGQDSNFVAALNWLHEKNDSVSGLLFGGNVGGVVTVNEVSTLRVVAPEITNAGYLRADSADIDSATITYLWGDDSTIRSYLHYDSGEFHSLRVDSGITAHTIDFDSGHIDSISGLWFNYTSTRSQQLYADSAHIPNHDTFETVWMNDSMRIDNLVISRGDSAILSHAKEFRLIDVAGNTLKAGYIFSTDSAPNVP